jgi:TonB-dependent starch-binding outer membrane protein SusC
MPKQLFVGFLLLLSVLPVTLLAQEKVVTGKVTDSKDGTGVANVTVTAKGSRTGTQTGLDGTYRISVSSSVTTLVFSAIGYATQEVVISGATADVSFVATSANLNEVVVVGYGTQRKKDLTGSITAVTAKDFVRGPITTPEQLIAGKVAGVQITSNSGQPGIGSRIRIRGGTSLNASNDPLIVIDGVPVENAGIAGAPNPLSLINPNDIESFNILKDASAAAIYGSRAANGVILITTKKGRSGDKVRVNFSTLNSIAVKTGIVDVMTADEFRGYVNANGSATEKALLGTANTNWQEEIYTSAFMTDNNIAVSGGIRKLPYRLSIGYLNQDGILKGSNLQRASVGLNLSPKFFDNHLSVNSQIKYSLSKNNFANQGAIGSAVYFDPTKPVYSGKTEYGGYTEWTNASGLNGLAPDNPVGLLNQRTDKSTVHRVIGNVQLDYKLHFFPDLRANLNLGLDKSDGSGSIFVPATAASHFTRKGINNKYEQDKTNKLLEFYLNYVKDIKSIKSRIDVIGGYSWQDWLTKSPAFADYQADGVTIQEPAGIPFETQNTLVSFYGRLNYNLMDRYLLTVTMRRDGSSRFSEKNRWGNFPSAAVAWKISDEEFLKSSRIISNMKLRIGWGITGQQDVNSDYGYLPAYFFSDSAARYQFGSSYITLARPQGFDANLKWEETETRNIGIDVGFLQNKINFSVDYYEKDTRDLLARVPAAAGTNFTNELLTNIGTIKNRGLEFTVNSNVINRGDFSLDLGFNLTYIIQNEITRLQLTQDPNYLGVDVGGTGFNNIQKYTVGYRPFTFFLYQQVYDNKTGLPIEGLYVDKDRDGIITDFDKNWVKNPEPTVFMGFSANATYRKFGAGFVMRAQYANYMYNAVRANSAIRQNVLTGQGYLNNGHSNILETGFANRQTWTDYYLENASFLRMDNIYLNYNVGKIMKGRADLRVNVNCQNVFVVTKYSGLDPEINGGIDNTIFPRPRIFALGLNLDF